MEALREVGLVEGELGTVTGVLSPVERDEVSVKGDDDIASLLTRVFFGGVGAGSAGWAI